MTSICRCGHPEDAHLSWKGFACDVEVREYAIAGGQRAVERCGCRGYVAAGDARRGYTPNPGADEAIAKGCICPIIDNGHGAGVGGDGKQFGWIRHEGCPLHWPVAAEEARRG